MTTKSQTMSQNKINSYEDAIKDLSSQGKFYINLGLERISKIMELFGNPQDSLKCIQVAGTNGKGSVCTMLASILQEAGYKVGLYTSPHIFEYTERIKINGVDISKSEFTDYYKEIIETADKNDIHLTEFEILTAIMYKYFYDKKVDIAVIETGLGGRFDATNILKTNLCAIITHIDLDHTERLGDTKDKIAFEKAGIIKPDSTVVTSESYEPIKDKADEVNAMFAFVSPFCGQRYVEALSLKGVQQMDNLSLVITAINYLFPEITDNVIIEGLKKVKNPFRFEYFEDRNLIVDGAHNPSCFSALAQNLDMYFPNVKRNYVFGALRNKDYKKMLGYIINDSNLNNLYFYHFDNKNSLTYEELKAVYPDGIELKSKNDIPYSKDILTVICGSFYMLKELVGKQ